MLTFTLKETILLVDKINTYRPNKFNKSQQFSNKKITH